MFWTLKYQGRSVGDLLTTEAFVAVNTMFSNLFISKTNQIIKKLILNTFVVCNCLVDSHLAAGGEGAAASRA
jgi:hypothetical protein